MADDERSKPTLILLHAAGRGGRSWRRVAPLLGDAFNVMTPDLPGFGGSPGPFSMERAVRVVAQLAAPHAPVRMCGLSLGASVALAAAAMHPDLVDRLVLCAPAIHSDGHERVIRWYRRMPGWLVRATTDLPDRAAWLSLITTITDVDLRPMLPLVRAKTLVMCGGRDRANLAEARLAAEYIPDGRFLLVPHVGHAWPVMQPQLFASAVTPFLTAAEASRQS